MTSPSPFERSDLPHAARLVAAEVADVYAVIDAVERWSSWIDGVAAPVRALDGDTFEVSVVHEGAMTTHRVAVVARGPVHTLYTQVDDAQRVFFRTRPNPSGTDVDVVAEPLDQGWRGRMSRRSRAARRTQQLEGLLDQLAAHVERGDTTPHDQ